MRLTTVKVCMTSSYIFWQQVTHKQNWSLIIQLTWKNIRIHIQSTSQKQNLHIMVHSKWMITTAIRDSINEKNNQEKTTVNRYDSPTQYENWNDSKFVKFRLLGVLLNVIILLLSMFITGLRLMVIDFDLINRQDEWFLQPRKHAFTDFGHY
jgi:hypothetical protein